MLRNHSSVIDRCLKVSFKSVHNVNGKRQLVFSWRKNPLFSGRAHYYSDVLHSILAANSGWIFFQVTLIVKNPFNCESLYPVTKTLFTQKCQIIEKSSSEFQFLQKTLAYMQRQIWSPCITELNGKRPV